MPFLEHYGLERYPFGLTPDTNLYYPSAETEGLLAALLFALTRGDGLLKITGEVGTGKTLICRLLLQRLKEVPMNTAYLNAPVGLSSEQLPSLIAKEFGLKIKKKDDEATHLREFLLKQHAKGLRNVLVIDEAQALTLQSLEAIRLLTNLETETDKLLQIVLLGQPELDRLLHHSSMRQFLQRVNFGFVMKSLAVDAVDSYLRFRLERCTRSTHKGRKKKPTPSVSFDAKATQHLARASAGVPRLLHILADKSLMAAYVEGKNVIEPAHVRAACRETQGLRQKGPLSAWSRLVNR